jgi:hypothetical protein
MRSFVRTRYGCDYCKKIGGSAFHMRKHEAGCTNNPGRVCSMHKIAAGREQELSMDELKQALAEGGFRALDEAAEHCPACILAALRQSWVAPDPGEPWPEEPQDGREKFNFKEAVRSMWAEHNASEAEQHGAYY